MPLPDWISGEGLALVSVQEFVRGLPVVSFTKGNVFHCKPSLAIKECSFGEKENFGGWGIKRFQLGRRWPCCLPAAEIW